MKADKELLELAAKAVGVVVFDFFDCGSVRSRVHSDIKWNPIADDGDAFRLAVKLNLSVDVSETWVNISYENKVKVSYPVISGEKTEMTRRAIVRAAAAIGEKL